MSRPLSPSIPIPAARRIALWLVGVTSRLVARNAGAVLRGLPEVDGFPVILARGDRQLTRARLATALASIAEYTPGRFLRMREHLIGLFVADQPAVHGHYSRLTRTAALDLATLHANEPMETAGFLVRAATEAWLWQAGRGRTAEDEIAILRLAERARRHFLERMRRLHQQAA